MDKTQSDQHIVSIINRLLKNHKEVAIKGLGTFSVEHLRQSPRQEKDGSIMITPPSDVIKFKPEKEDRS